ncbi:MAG: peptide ABC transporter substrate-binding protein [Anaerolineales bacterium]|nr:peptide ABC transporter substrate-binding protein [Anaerolineales bacterium]
MIRYIRWQILLVLLGVSVAGILLSQQAVELEEIFVPASGGTLIEGVVGRPQYLNPLLSFDNPVDRDICALVFEGLTAYNEQGQLVPVLATDWNVSLDGLVYTFWLRRNVRWQDGTTFSADDVVFTFQLLQDPDYPGPFDLGAFWQSVQVEKVNDWTVTFSLTEPYAPFLDYTTIGLVPIHLLEGVHGSTLAGHRFNKSPIGTGLFQVASEDWESGKISLTANPIYREKRPQLSGIDFIFFDDYAQALNAFEQGTVHTISDIRMEVLPQAQSIEGLDLFTSILPSYSMVLFNLQDNSIFEKSMRQALLYGLDRPALIADVLNGQGIVADSPIFPGSWASYGEVKTFPPDLDLAESMMDSIGWVLPKQDGIKSKLLESEEFQAGIRTRDEREFAFTLKALADPLHQALARNIAHQWARLGVRVTVIPVVSENMMTILETHDFDAILVDVDVKGDPDMYAFWSESAVQEGQNYGGWLNREASQVLEEARQLTNLGQRTVRYYRFQQIFVKETPAILLYYHTFTYGVSDKVRKATMGPLTDPSDRFATIDEWFLVWREVIIRKVK